MRAQERAALHRHLGSAYAPASLAICADTEFVPDEGLAAASFLSDRGVVGLFVRHKLLESLNAKLDYTSPSLLLGVDRRHDEETRTSAREALLALVWEAVDALPDPVRRGFELLATRTIETAYLDCRAAHDRKAELDATYVQERKRHLEWLHQMCELKQRLEHLAESHLFARGARWRTALLDELVLLDLIPIANSDQFLIDVKRRLSMQQDPTTLTDAFTRLRGGPGLTRGGG